MSDALGRCQNTTWSTALRRDQENCRHPAKVIAADGKRYCGIHDPARRAAQYQATLDRYDRENKRRADRVTVLQMTTATKILRDLAAGTLKVPDADEGRAAYLKLVAAWAASEGFADLPGFESEVCSACGHAWYFADDGSGDCPNCEPMTPEEQAEEASRRG